MPFWLEVILRSGVPPHMGQSPEPGSDAETTGDRRQTAAPSSNRKMMALAFMLLNFICSRTPLGYRNKVQRDRCRKFPALPGGWESDRCARSSMRQAQVHRRARLYLERESCHRGGSEPPVSDGTRYRLSRRKEC